MTIERFLVIILREAAFRHFVNNPRGNPAAIIRFLRASQRYVDAGAT